jgi:HlyD family secretion protein
MPLSSVPDVSTGAGVIGSGHLSALGTILPAQRVKLGFSASGPVRVVEVEVGTQVKAGDVLAELDTAELELAVQEAEDELALNRALLEQARASAREQDLTIARAAYERALAQYEQLLAGARPEEMANGPGRLPGRPSSLPGGGVGR